jgi:hypothetical protein
MGNTSETLYPHELVFAGAIRLSGKDATSLTFTDMKVIESTRNKSQKVAIVAQRMHCVLRHPFANCGRVLFKIIFEVSRFNRCF